ncbi:MAG: class I adenylate cyclase [Methylococcales bacterium]
MKATQRFNPETAGTPVAEIGRQEVIRRFQKLHQLRLERLQGFLSTKQQVFIPLLPLLFHQNIPLLPGFIHAETPSGLANYLPDRQALLIAKTFSKSYSYKPSRPQTNELEAIFLVGNSASIAFSKSQKIDIWVFYKTDLTISQREALHLKAKNIADWAGSLGLFVSFYLLDSIAFLKGCSSPVVTEGNSYTSHALLLDEFYRSSIYIAGKFPAWWVIPPHEEKNYPACLEYLKRQRFIQEQDLIDLGGMGDVQPEELIRADFQQLYTAHDAPYTALLPLFLLDCYVNEYPQPDWVCLHLKQAVYEGALDIDELDPYALTYRKIERHAHEHPEKLLLSRQCFYLTITGKQSHQSNANTTQALRLEFMQKAAQDWQWPVNLLPDLMTNRFWNLERAVSNTELIQRQLQQGCVKLEAFIQNHAQISGYDHSLELMGQQAHAYLSPKPGGVDVLCTQSSICVQESEFFLLEQVFPDGQPMWLLFAGKAAVVNAGYGQPVKCMGSYFATLVWLVANGLYQKHIILTVTAETIALSSLECHRICRSLLELFGSPIEKVRVDFDTYGVDDTGRLSLAFINLGEVDALGHNDSKAIVNQQTDAFRYGVNQGCLIQSINSVMISTLGEITVKRYLGQTGLLEYFIDLLNTLEKPLRPEQLELVCYTAMRGNCILNRMNSTFRQLCKTFSQPKLPPITRYFLAVGRCYYCIQCREGVFSYWEMPTKSQLYQILEQPQGDFCQAAFDPQIALNSMIPTLYAFNQPNKIQLFYLSSAAETSVYVLDEKGALFVQHYPLTNTAQLLNDYAVFLGNVLKQYFFDRRLDINFYEILLTPGKGLRCKSVDMKPLSAESNLAIRISATQGEANKIDYRIDCNGQVFTSLEYGSAVFSCAAEFIARYRQEHNHYPLHITAVDVPLAVLGVSSLTQLQTVHLLHFKQKLAGRLLG